MTTNYSPPAPNGIHYAVIHDVSRRSDATYIYYDIAVGDSVGWATNGWIQTGHWPLVQRIDARAGNIYTLASGQPAPPAL